MNKYTLYRKYVVAAIPMYDQMDDKSVNFVRTFLITLSKSRVAVSHKPPTSNRGTFIKCSTTDAETTTMATLISTIQRIVLMAVFMFHLFQMILPVFKTVIMLSGILVCDSTATSYTVVSLLDLSLVNGYAKLEMTDEAAMSLVVVLKRLDACRGPCQ